VVESEGIPAIFIHGMEGKGYNVFLRSHLRRLRQRNSLDAVHSWEKYLRTHDEHDE
jgi:hypothetical protein